MSDRDWTDIAEQVADQLTNASDPSWSFDERAAAERVLATALATVYQMGREDAGAPPIEPGRCDHPCLACAIDKTARTFAEAVARISAMIPPADEPAERRQETTDASEPQPDGRGPHAQDEPSEAGDADEA